MKNLLYISVFLTGVFVLTLMFSQKSLAQCVVTDTTPGGGEVVVCTGTDNNGLTTTNDPDDVTVQPGADITRIGEDVIRTLDGDDMIHINGGTITSSDFNIFDCIDFGTGNNEVHMLSGTLTCEHGIRGQDPCTANITIEGGVISAAGVGDEAISTCDGNDIVNVAGGTITGTDAAIQTFEGDDQIIITGGTIIQDDNSDPTLKAGSGNDLIAVSHATVDGSMTDKGAIWGGSNDDTVKLGTGAIVLNTMYGGSSFVIDNGFDTLVFEMEVPAEAIDLICSQIFAQDPQNGSITINDLFYEWEGFDVLLCELVPSEPRPIPTLSEWGLIAMAGVLGIIGLLAIRRRKLTA